MKRIVTLKVGKEIISFPPASDAESKLRLEGVSLPSDQDEADALLSALSELRNWMGGQLQALAEAFNAKWGRVEEMDPEEEFRQDQDHWFQARQREAAREADVKAKIADSPDLTEAVKGVLLNLPAEQLAALAQVQSESGDSE